ncbi:TPA: GIY-YIG nuclease family protein [Burkholderia vietnamiensis]|nr:GIY-YIG nuclease family protein [Burkholderia vietnamiensis]RQM52947.1 GIY-YIG nuclease family protein [Burkholderia vietnamiensis]HDR9028546.1 GIY-YIG nuclease family protein [Burkholderia vietnamiensis]HDR9202679.1 GIY-YIG nuclease family protein [Burkholderia vietnamiensis]
MQPFSITLFATTGDPEGIRHVDKSNWSGYGVVFTKELAGVLKQEPGISQAGIYILAGNAAEETIYIGEADPVGERLKNHVANKEGWVWGVYFFDRNHKIGKTEVQYLESALVALAKKYDRAILLNKNNPTEPTMAPAAKATAQAFLADMLLILPMLGINAFTPSKIEDVSDQVQPIGSDSDKFDTIVVPARDEGFKDTFLDKNCWYAVRINAKHISKLRYIAAYQVAPIAAITHIAEIESIVPYNDTGKYKINFKEAATAIVPIPRPEVTDVNMQSSRYALRDKLLAAKNLDEVWA